MAKEGFFTGRFAINPFTNLPVPIWVANYVLGEYGTGAVMGVAAHDERDFDFAQKYSLPIIPVIRPTEGQPPAEGAFYETTPNDVLFNSGRFDGMKADQAIKMITEDAEERGIGHGTVQFRLRTGASRASGTGARRSR